MAARARAGMIAAQMGELRDIGSAITVLIADRHALVRRALRELIDVEPGFAVVGQAAAAGALPPAEAGTLKRLVLEIVERQVAHIQKETMALLPLLDDLLDDDTDRELAFAYAAG